MVCFVVETREGRIAANRVNPDGARVKQIARNLPDSSDGFLRDVTCLVHVADPLFTADFRAFFKAASYSGSSEDFAVQRYG